MKNVTTPPRVRAAVRHSTAEYIDPSGSITRIVTSDGEDIRTKIVARTKQLARERDETVELITSGDRGDHHLVITADGAVSRFDMPSGSGSLPDLTTDPPVTVAYETSPEPGPDRAATEPVTVVSPMPADDVPVSGILVGESDEEPEPRRARRSFIDTHEPTRVPPESGWRRVAAAFGFKVAASPREMERETNRRAVSAQWGEGRRIAVVNGKGGVGKTMTTGMLAAVFARHGGGGVVAWDNNPTRGSLGWRTETARHDATVQDVLEQADTLLDPDAPRSLIADFVHHQTDDRYDVLRSNPELLAIRQQIAAPEFDLISRVIDRHYRMVVFDSGNDESADRWLRMIDWSHQLVIPTIPSPESAESAALLLQALSERDERSRDLAERAIVVVTMNEHHPSADTNSIVEGLRDSNVVHVVPFDPALKSGPLRFGQLHPTTQDAWLRVAAAATESF